MFKRRIVILGAAGALALAGLGGSALAANASDDPTQDQGTVTCTTSDGKVLKLQAASPVTVDKDGNLKQGDPADAPYADAVPATPLESAKPLGTAPSGSEFFSKTTPTEDGEKVQGTVTMRQEEGKPAQRLDTMGVPPKDGTAKAFSVKCVKDQ